MLVKTGHSFTGSGPGPEHGAVVVSVSQCVVSTVSTLVEVTVTSYVAVLTSVMVEVETSTCRTVEYSVVVSVLTSAVGQSVVMQVAPLQMVVGVSVTCAAAFLIECYEIMDFIS